MFFSIFLATSISMTAYLQAESKWWKGLLAAICLFAFGFVYLLSYSNLNAAQLTKMPATGLVSALLASSFLIGLGSVISLVLRSFQLAPKQIAMFAFGLGLTFVIGIRFAS